MSSGGLFSPTDLDSQPEIPTISNNSKILISQMGTYWFVSWWFNNQKAQKSKA